MISHSYAMKLWNVTVAEDLPVFIWRTPGETVCNIMIPFRPPQSYDTIDFSHLIPGFVVQPFIGELLFYEADVSSSFGIPDAPAQQPAGRKMIEILENAEDRDTFLSNVKKTVSAIKEDVFHKAVLSRTIKIKLPANFQAVDLFEKMCRQYPNTFAYSFYLPGSKEIWVGASPETLISVKENRLYATAMAGTKPAEDDTAWTNKEYVEHSIVGEFIEKCFLQAGCKQYTITGPITAYFGHLKHLQTHFCAALENGELNVLATAMVKLMHPTPAVCGMPSPEAKQFILNTEPHQRDLYTGFIGPVNVAARTDLFVNIRCMRINGNIGTLFVGCGITAASDPEMELAESDIKSHAILNLLMEQ
ncbi:MAG TPA: chorismate-binding protein [Chitinophaga sp.]|uniref:chorismate-binding protein n=1 Tax=Chitinophaga sp. TaxID=1869181 RepID=UPI002B7E7FA3|nr:chorismate-binding protein [Chitinophaga sp.]HVI49202.1 chorismate-binding protein [Chitinophaga sp.]